VWGEAEMSVGDEILRSSRVSGGEGGAWDMVVNVIKIRARIALGRGFRS
jgi:hypothetical protein